VCPEWKAQQKILWAEVRKETGRWKSRWKIRDLLADGFGQAAVDFHSSTDVGRLVPAAEEDDAGRDVSQWERREFREWEEEGREEAEALGAGKGLPLLLPTSPFREPADEE